MRCLGWQVSTSEQRAELRYLDLELRRMAFTAQTVSHLASIPVTRAWGNQSRIIQK